ncbi:MAG TPA: hypothetical protein VF117_06550, partial [Gammaproteobacteria bacterium]
MKKNLILLFVLVGALLGGCAVAPHAPVALGSNALVSEKGTVGVAMTALPKADTSFPGAGCLLCMAAASAANSSLTAYTRTLPEDDISNIKQSVVELLRSEGIHAIVLPENINIDKLNKFPTEGPNLAKKDFRPFKKKYSIDKLLVINITELGFLRTYQAYIPSSDPKAYMEGAGFLVNLDNNAY